jgi:hypothetical protein
MPVAGALPDPGAPELPFVTHTGVLTIPGVGPIPCYHLNTGERVVDGPTVARLFGLDDEDLDADAEETL